MNAIEAALNGMNRHGWRILILAGDLPVGSNSFVIAAKHPRSLECDADLSLATSEKRHIAITLALMEHNVSGAARRLGIGKATLYRKIRRYGIAARNSAQALIA